MKGKCWPDPNNEMNMQVSDCDINPAATVRLSKSFKAFDSMESPLLRSLQDVEKGKSQSEGPFERLASCFCKTLCSLRVLIRDRGCFHQNTGCSWKVKDYGEIPSWCPGKTHHWGVLFVNKIVEDDCETWSRLCKYRVWTLLGVDWGEIPGPDLVIILVTILAVRAHALRCINPRTWCCQCCLYFATGMTHPHCVRCQKISPAQLRQSPGAIKSSLGKESPCSDLTWRQWLFEWGLLLPFEDLVR